MRFSLVSYLRNCGLAIAVCYTAVCIGAALHHSSGIRFRCFYVTWDIPGLFQEIDSKNQSFLTAQLGVRTLETDRGFARVLELQSVVIEGIQYKVGEQVVRLPTKALDVDGLGTDSLEFTVIDGERACVISTCQSRISAILLCRLSSTKSYGLKL